MCTNDCRRLKSRNCAPKKETICLGRIGQLLRYVLSRNARFLYTPVYKRDNVILQSKIDYPKVEFVWRKLIQHGHCVNCSVILRAPRYTQERLKSEGKEGREGK